MLSLRRYIVYAGLAACFLLTLISYNRYSSLSQANYGSQQPGKTDDLGGSIWPAFSSDPGFKWNEVPIRYPLESLTPLPAGKPLQLPKVQYDFSKDTKKNSAERKRRLSTVKQAFEKSWKAYQDYAWMKDEVSPLSGGSSDNFGGWAATLVDSLDTLWIMDMKSEFEEAVEAAIEIDLGSCQQDQINVFETTIRHLGGFLAAYDLSGDPRLLEKAQEFGDMLIVAFDTPNRMPITRWYPRSALAGVQEADTNVLVAEIGSLSMEFTRLSMVTGDAKYYDAVERIVQVLDEQQNKTYLPGMWPVTVNAKEMDFNKDSLFTLSAMSDSLYEYFPKMHALLGGVDLRYKKLYEGSMETAIEHNLWRPMTPDNADVLISGQVRRMGNGETAKEELDPQGQHLVCFAGGMFALGGKLFGKPDHVTIGKKITNGCIWTYKACPLGIMPEVFRMVPCESKIDCKWSEAKWKKAVSEANNNVGDPDKVIMARRLPKGFTEIADGRYILRPEAIESVFLLYRMTGEQYYQDAAWEMFTAIKDATETDLAFASLRDVSYMKAQQRDSMESFWMAETLKYFYVIFSEPDVISLDEWVFNTEAHPFKRRLPEG